jgi:hypothetical protein
MSTEQMIIFDYSGTLSLEAPLFAEPDSLMNQLEESGLREFGIDSPHIFWEKIVNPTWMEGSTTAAGYKTVLQNRIIAHLHPDLSGPLRARLAEAAATFVDRYLSRSRIDPRWAPILRKINTSPAVKTVIATDHYAEATDYIIKFLGDWQIESATAMDASLHSQAASFIVANSADMGVHKADSRFWQILKTNLCLDTIHHVLIIDDFGYNEQGADRYREGHKVEARMEQTVMTLKTVFSAAVQVFHMMIGTDDHGRDGLSRNLIEEASAVIDRVLTSR